MSLFLAGQALTQPNRRRAVIPAAASSGDVVPETLWLDASDATTFSYTSATNVNVWSDKSVSANHATTAGGTPDRSGTQNGLTTVLFDASNLEYMSLPNAFTGLSAAEMFIVVKVNNDPPGGDDHSGLYTFGSTGSGSHFPYTDGNVYDGFGSTTRATVGNPTPALTTCRIYNVISTSSEWTAKLDGTQIFTTATNTVGFTTAPLLGKSASGNYFFDGALSEFRIYNRKLSSGENTAVKAVLASKWGTA